MRLILAHNETRNPFPIATPGLQINLNMIPIEAKVIAAWKMAANDIGIQITSPYAVTLEDGGTYEYLGLVHQFGRRIGTIIGVLDAPSMQSPHPTSDDYFYSILGASYEQYDRQLFINTLNDWQFFGPDCQKPVWYSGKPWS